MGILDAIFGGRKSRIKYWIQGYFINIRNGASKKESIRMIISDFFSSPKGSRYMFDILEDDDLKSTVVYIVCREYGVDRLSGQTQIDEEMRVRREFEEVYEKLLPTYEYLLKK